MFMIAWRFPFAITCAHITSRATVQLEAETGCAGPPSAARSA